LTSVVEACDAMNPTNPRRPAYRVFVSSTHEDLRDCRDEVKEAVIKAGFMPVMSRYWAASGSLPPLERCLQEVSATDLLIVIVAHRYGWVPPDQAGLSHRSITWLECERAAEEKLDNLAIVLADDAPWPVELREEYRATLALMNGHLNLDEMASIRRSVDELRNFKGWLDRRGIVARFRTLADLRSEVIAALNDWWLRNAQPDPLGQSRGPREADSTKALRSVWEQTRFIDVRGLQVGSGKAHRFPIEELYIPLASTSGGTEARGERPDEPSPDGSGPVHDALQGALRHRRLVIIGDPGSGKTTFLRRIAHALSGSLLEIDPEGAGRIGFSGSNVPLPMLVRLSDFEAFVRREPAQGADRTSGDEPAERLVRFLAANAAENAWGLGVEFYRERLEAGALFLLLDGLDEVPTEGGRKLVSELVQEAAGAYDGCRFIVTSRPKAYSENVALNNFAETRVALLEDHSISVFLRHWCQALYLDASDRADAHRAELERALEDHPEIRRMARNPVMLTALAVVHWNERRIPEQRADLYGSIVNWLARSREDRGGRLPADRCVVLLQEIALAMQSDLAGRQTEVLRTWAAERLVATPEFPQTGDEALVRAVQFLTEEELDSGIIVRRGDHLRFWHLSFQEYLAGRALAARTEQDQGRVLLDHWDRLISPEWRETVLLFAGILHAQGPPKVDAMVSRIIDTMGRNASIPTKANVVGVIGAIQRDLFSLRYRVRDSRYESTLHEVMTIFDADAAGAVNLQLRLEAADAIGQFGDPRLTGTRWVTIGGAQVILGAQSVDPSAVGFDAGALAMEGPPREVTLPTFQIARFPVTGGEYEKFVDDQGYHWEPYWADGGFGLWKHPDQWDSQIPFPSRPVVGVSWFEAAAYCRWKGAGVQLLTEAQWERAARGVNARKFPWGDTPPENDRLNYAGSGIGRPTPVGFFPLGATPEGAHDLAGNVFEWCEDGFTDDPCREWPSTGGLDPADVGVRVVRGGSFRNVAYIVRSSFRGRYRPDYRSSFLGFRVGRPLAP
jgi:formylglycine-generating enzyme required for sulfatase activity